MHLSMHNWMRAEPIEVTIARLARFGYSSIEISGEPEIYDTKHVKGLLDDAGLFCWGSVTLMLGERNMVAKDEAARAASVQYVKAESAGSVKGSKATRSPSSRAPSARSCPTLRPTKSGSGPSTACARSWSTPARRV